MQFLGKGWNVMKKIIVYGLGKQYEDHREWIHKTFCVTGYCDSDGEKLKNYEPAVELKKINELEYDYVLITTANVIYITEITQQLLSYGVERRKIRILQYEESLQGILGACPKAVSWSGMWEDLIIDRIFRELGISYDDMRYIELGVMDPVVANNTFYFYHHGARGILVEANPELIENIKYVRPKDSVINKAIYAGEANEISFFVSENPGLSSLKADWSEQEENWKQYKRRQEIKVPTIHINDVFELLEEKCNLLSIDIEGYDYEALKSLDFCKYRPQVIIVELLGGAHTQDSLKIAQLLFEQGYLLYAKNQCNGIFYDQCYVNRLQ